MWFKSVFLKSLRDYRVAILGWGIGMGLVIVSPMASVSELVKTPEARAALLNLAASFTWNADVIKADTIGGYATFKIGIFIFLMVVWPILAGSRMLRGEEDRASLDVLLSAPRGRVRIAIEKLAAIWAALLAMAALIGILAYLGGLAFKADFTLADAVLFGLNLALICAVFGAIALFVSQFTRERGPAAGWTAGLLLIFIVLDMVHRVIPNTDWISRLSPIYYYNLSKPLIVGYGANLGAMLFLVALTLVLAAAAIWLFARRDVGDTVALPRVLRLPQRVAAPRALPINDWSLRSIYARNLGVVAVPTFWWALLVAGWAGWMVVIVKQIEAKLSVVYSASPALQDLLKNLSGGNADFNASFLGAMFGILPIFLMAFAITQVNRWASDEGDGRLDLVLAAPRSRTRVLLGRFAALTTAVTVIGLAALAATLVASSVSGVALNTANVVAATLTLVPMGLLVAAIGFLAAGWLRTAADTGLVSFLLAAWFFISFVGPELKVPEATLRLSAFYYYGTPLLHGVQLANLAILLAVGALALALGVLRFARKDIAV